ncbi:Translational activator GCN1, partial [Ophiophagus hannah]
MVPSTGVRVAIGRLMDLPEGAVKGLCKLFCLTLHRYRCRIPQSPSNSSSPACRMPARSDREESFVLSAIFRNQQQQEQWICSFAGSLMDLPARSHCLPDTRQEAWRNVEVQCFLLLEILGGSRKPVVNGAVKKLNRLWKENPGLVDQYLSIILHLEANQGYAIMLGLLVQFCTSQKDLSTINKHKDYFFKLRVNLTIPFLTGAEGKLTVVAQKISVLSGIGSCSHHAVSGASNQVLSGTMVELFIPFLQQEVHEGTLVHAISILALWCGRFVTEVPKMLVEWFKKAFSLKACTSAVRHAYLQCMLASFKGNVLLQGSEMLPLLIQTVEKAGAQSTQIPLVTEGVAAALLICRLSVADAQIENKLNSFWQLILDEKKQIFTSEKFLQSASEEVMCTVLQLTERLLLDHECRLPGAKIHRSWSVRRLAQQTVRKLLSLPRGFKLACGLLDELKAVLVSHKVLPPEALVTESGELSEQGKTYIPPRILQEALCVIACGPGMEGEPEEKEKLVLEMLLSSLNAVGLLSVLLPARVLPQLISTISASLGNPALCLVTQEEFAIMKMPEGELYDKSILHSAQQDSLKKANMKRENKAYSFKEQIIELELKEEEIQLTSKQKEMLTAQLEKESQMRKQLKEYIPALVGCFLPLLKSPLAAPRIKAPFLSLVSCVMPDHLKTFGPVPLSAPAFSLVFPLLKMVLLETPNDSEEKEELMVKVLQIITVHAQLRSSTNDENWLVDENGPELLPRTDMLLLLTKVIGTGSPRVQVLGSVALTALCASSSGEDGCAYAEQEEINVLLQALQSPCMNVRDAALRGLMELQMVLPTPDSDEKNGMNLLRRLWVVKFDREEEIRMLAERLWVSMALELQPDICSILIQDVIHHEQAVRQAGAEALSKGVEQYRSQTKDRPPPVLDALGRVILESPPDQWEASSQVKPLFEFFVPDALNDRHPEVRKCMLDAALSALNTHGKENVNSLLPVFEEFLKNAPNDASYDAVRQSVVILMGSLAKHLDKSDPKVKPIVAKLIAALSTPSQQVQESVASCLPPLVPAIKEDAGSMIQKLLQLLLESDKYAERKGAAYGLAGLVKGLGILSLKQQEMMAKLTDAIQDKKNFRRREDGNQYVRELLLRRIRGEPKPLSSCLPNIVPKLTEVLTDSHVKVQKAGQQALRQIGSVIRNPEILAIAPVLLDALTDPSRKTQKCLQTLLDTKFVHFIDAPSLALIMPIVQRAFQDRSTDTRKMAAQIIGNMYSLTDQKVRTVSAKALGAMVKGMGESCFEDLLPWLMETLTYEQSSVDRSGAAQEKLEKLMPEIVATASKVDIAPHVRDGYIMMFNYLPITFGEKFTPYVGPIIPCILKALADENEFVRDTALRAGQRIISMYSSVQLLGDLLFHISGLAVRQASLHVWKIVVSNTPRTLREILPTLFGLLLGFLASTCADKRTIAARTLGDLVRKLGEKILPEIIPILEEGLRSEKSDKRQGVCIGLSEIMKSTSRDAVLCFSDSLVPTVRKALCDPLEEVREAAAKTFEQLHSTIGFQALEDILPFLLKQLLISPPVNTRVLAFLSSVAGDALTRHLGDEAGQRIIIEDLLDTTRSAEVGRRQAAAVILNIYCSKTKADYTAHLRNLVSGLIRLFNDTNAVVLNESWDALNAISKLALIDDLHRDIRIVGNDAAGEHVPGFCIPKKGVTSILPMLREGVLTGNSDQKEEAAKALGLVIKLTSAEALKPSVVSITGPLIRILGDRFSWNVKVALLETLSLLLAKVGLALKPFLPQLQTTFTKALQDPNRVVRLKAAEALGKLIAIHAKVDPLFTELLNGIRTTLRFVTQGAGAKVDAAVRKSIISMLLSMLGHEEDATRMTSAGCLAEMCAFLTDDELSGVLQNHLLADVSGIDWMVRHGRSLALSVAVNTAASRLCAPKYLNSCLQNPSSDIKLIAEKMIWWANKAPLPPLDPPVAKPILKALLDNTKDKNTSVRAYSDQAIVNLLKMRDGEETVQILDAASLELLNESCRRSLKKLANQADSVEQIDDTILT